MTEEKKPGLLNRCWSSLRKPSARYSVLALVVVGFFSGIIFWGGFHTALDATNTIEFCVGCHEMRDNVYQEYQGTIHDSNRTGVRAICSDCHVPKDWGHKMLRKIQASNEVLHKAMGTVDTPEKFEAHRMEMASRVWKTMKESNSRECRNCHSFEAMNSSKQSPRAQKNHAEAQKVGKTCIDCHKGIAHLLPREYNEDE
jgi:cytochrome c-type protein NapC